MVGVRRLASAQAKVTGIQSDINYNHSRIAARKREISSARVCYDRQAWHYKTWAFAKCSYEAAWRSTEIAGRAVAIAGLEASRATAIGALEVAKQTLRGMEAAAVVTPIDADPRVAGLFVARDVAIAALGVAKGVLTGLEQLEGRLVADLHLNIGTSGLDGSVQGQACWASRCYSTGGGRVTLQPKPQVCLTIPAVAGEICANF